MNSESAGLDWSAIGGDVAKEIFKRVEVKTLGRSRCVCKGWNSLISSPQFIAAHHSFAAASTPVNRKPYLLVGGGWKRARPRTCTGDHSCLVLYHPPGVPQHAKRLLSPFLRFRDRDVSDLDFDVVDVINGVVCVSYSLSSPFDSNFLWNPAIHRYVDLPWLPIPKENWNSKKKKKALRNTHRNTYLVQSRFRSEAIGFGYQSCSNDFKVVRIWIRSSCLRYQVFSLQQGLWEEAKAAENLNALTGFKHWGFMAPPTGCFFNETVHWLLSTSNDDDALKELRFNNTYSLLLLMFDCEREEFTTAELPKELNRFQVFIFRNQPSSSGSTRLIKYSDMLSVLLSCCLVQNQEPHFELWVKSNSISNTWNKLFRIQAFVDIHSYIGDYWLSEDGHTFKCVFGNLAMSELYDPNNNSKSESVKERFYVPLNGYVCEETLFLMDHRFI